MIRPHQTFDRNATSSSYSSGEGPSGLEPFSGIQHKRPPKASMCELDGLQMSLNRHFDAFGDFQYWISDGCCAQIALAGRR